MPENLKQIGNFFSQYGADLVLYVAGVLGASQRPSLLDSSLSKRQRQFAYLMGGVTSVLLTHFVAFIVQYLFKLELSVNLYPAVGYFLGHWGLTQISDMILKIVNKKNTNEK